MTAKTNKTSKICPIGKKLLFCAIPRSSSDQILSSQEVHWGMSFQGFIQFA